MVMTLKKNYHYLQFFTVIIVILCVVLYGINSFITKKESLKKLEEEKNKEFDEKSTIEYKANQTIRVKYSKTGNVVAMDINDYLRGVVPSEMPPSYNIEALKAQAIVARTYTYKKMMTHGEGEEADMCDNHTHCQAFYDKDTLFSIWRKRGFSEDLIKEYWNKINEAVVSTQNQVITYNGEYIKAFFHASSPYKTENIDQIWGGEKLPYLVSVENEEKEDYQNRTSCVKVTFDDFKSKIKEKYGKNVTDDECRNACINEYTTSGRIKNIKCGELVISAENLRVLFSLKSTDFKLDIEDNNLVFNVTGYGHGIGMSQVGADTYANKGYGYEDIIKHYYTGVEITTLSSN